MVKTKILLVEDDKSLREIYGVRLYSEGYDIISAGDGEEALAMAIKERPILIISDVMMPKISGFDMLDILRSTTETKDIRVIMMTALSSEDQRQRGEALGADRYLVKSQVGIEDVVRTVHEVLGDAPVSGMATPAPAAPVAATPAPAAPAPAPAPAPIAPSMFAEPAATAPVATESSASALPQPTAPFSTNRPASLGDRVIHPLESSEPPVDFSAMINAELGSPSTGPAAPITPAVPAPQAPVASQPEPDFSQIIPPIPAPADDQTTFTTPAPQATAQPVEQFQAPVSSAPSPEPATPVMPQPFPAPQTPPTGMSFEETPYAPNPVVPGATQTPGVNPADSQTGEPSIVIPPRPTPGVQ